MPYVYTGRVGSELVYAGVSVSTLAEVELPYPDGVELSDETMPMAEEVDTS